MIYLNVPFEQKDTAKNLGCRWAPQAKKWYFPGDVLPEGLQQFADDNTSSEQANQAEITRLVEQYLAELPVLAQDIIQDMKQSVATVTAPMEGLTLAETQTVLAQSLADQPKIIRLATEALFSCVNTDQENLEKFIKGTCNLGTLLSTLTLTFGGPTKTQADILKALKKIKLRKLVSKAINKCGREIYQQKWDALKQQVLSDFDFLAELDIDGLDHAKILKGDGRFTLGGITFQLTYTGLHDSVNGETEITREGKFVGWFTQHDAFKALKKRIGDFIHAQYEAKLNSVQLCEQRSIVVFAPGSNDWSTTTKDQRTISGFTVDDEWYLTHVQQHRVASDLPKAVALSEQVKSLYYEQQKSKHG